MATQKNFDPTGSRHRSSKRSNWKTASACMRDVKVSWKPMRAQTDNVM